MLINVHEQGPLVLPMNAAGADNSNIALLLFLQRAIASKRDGLVASHAHHMLADTHWLNVSGP